MQKEEWVKITKKMGFKKRGNHPFSFTYADESEAFKNSGEVF